MAEQIVRPVVQTAYDHGTWQISGVDASTSAGERLAREFDQAPSPEDLIGVVWEAIEAGVRMFAYSGQRWIQFNPAQVVHVECAQW